MPFTQFVAAFFPLRCHRANYEWGTSLPANMAANRQMSQQSKAVWKTDKRKRTQLMSPAKETHIDCQETQENGAWNVKHFALSLVQRAEWVPQDRALSRLTIDKSLVC